MRRTLTTLALTLALLVALDAAVAGLLALAERQGRLGALVRYFDYGRSVPGKLAQWEAEPALPGNLYDVAWLGAGVAGSATAFAAEPPGTGPVLRSYGMSFIDNILHQAAALDPTLRLDRHSGPAAPPNFAYAYFLDDRANRRAGDGAILAILSSSVAAMAALSNRTWMFEQPAPFTYPIFRPEGEAGLSRTDPLIAGAAEQRSLATDAARARAWSQQLAREDAFYGPVTHAAPILDRSPFARLVRRALAQGHVARTERAVLGGARYPDAPVLERMATRFAETARQDGQRPLVVLIQSRDPADPDLAQVLRPTLDGHGIAVLATVDHADPRDPSLFVGDGHYRPEIDRRFARALLDWLAEG